VVTLQPAGLKVGEAVGVPAGVGETVRLLVEDWLLPGDGEGVGVGVGEGLEHCSFRTYGAPDCAK